MSDCLLDVSDVSAYYGSMKAVHNVSMRIDKGEIVALMGPNGAGKTSVLRAMLGLIKKQGSVRFDGKDVSRLPCYALVQQGLGVVPDGRGTLTQLSVLENLKLAASYRKDTQVKQDIEKIYDYFPIFKARNHVPAGLLSGGEQEMLAIARALMVKPKLMLLDEPSLGLAPVMIKQVFTALKHIHAQENVSILLIEQNVHVALNDFAHRAYVMEAGKTVYASSAKDLLHNETLLQSYLGEVKRKES